MGLARTPAGACGPRTVSDAVVYLDSSALLKLIFEEPETAALADFLEQWPVRVSSALAEVEVTRIAARVDDPAVRREVRRVLRGVHLVRIDDDIVRRAAAIGPAALRSLDAIHLATAQLFGIGLAGMVAYDRHLARVATSHGITVWSPA